MPLKLRVSENDKITVGDFAVITIQGLTDRYASLAIASKEGVTYKTVRRNAKMSFGHEVNCLVMSVSAHKVQFSFSAPLSIPIHAIFNDPEQQFKNSRKQEVA